MDWWSGVVAAVLAAGGELAPLWDDTDEVAEDGYLAAMPDEDKVESERIYARELDEQVQEAEHDGDAARAAFYARQACEARARVTR